MASFPRSDSGTSRFGDSSDSCPGSGSVLSWVEDAAAGACDPYAVDASPGWGSPASCSGDSVSPGSSVASFCSLLSIGSSSGASDGSSAGRPGSGQGSPVPFGNGPAREAMDVRAIVHAWPVRPNSLQATRGRRGK